MSNVSGHAYVLEFSTGVVKIGSSASVDNRIGTHRCQAAKFGVRITAQVVSEAHVGYEATEHALLKAATTLGGVCIAGREWFAGVSYDALTLELSKYADICVARTS